MGVPTRHFAETVAFFRDVLGLEAEREDADFAVLRLPSGEAVEVFAPASSRARSSSLPAPWSVSRSRT